MKNLDRYGQIMDAEIIDERLTSTNRVTVSQAELNNLRTNKTGWTVLLISLGVVGILGSLLLVVNAVKHEPGANQSCQSDCNSISVF